MKTALRKLAGPAVAGLRLAFLLAALVAPQLAMGSVQAGHGNLIESSFKAPSGAGLVILVGLQRL